VLLDLISLSIVFVNFDWLFLHPFLLFFFLVMLVNDLCCHSYSHSHRMLVFLFGLGIRLRLRLDYLFNNRLRLRFDYFFLLMLDRLRFNLGLGVRFRLLRMLCFHMPGQVTTGALVVAEGAVGSAGLVSASVEMLADIGLASELRAFRAFDLWLLVLLLVVFIIAVVHMVCVEGILIKNLDYNGGKSMMSTTGAKSMIILTNRRI